MSMNLTQWHIRRREQIDTAATDQWLKQCGLNAQSFHCADRRTLEAKRAAHSMLTQDADRLSAAQRGELEQFQRMVQGHRGSLKVSAASANRVLNMSAKLKRQLFKAHRQLGKAAQTGN